LEVFSILEGRGPREKAYNSGEARDAAEIQRAAQLNNLVGDPSHET
jgi:hypothetical protein